VSGDIWVDGRHVAADRRGEFEGIRGRVIAMVLQDTARSLDPTRRIGQQIADAVALHLRLHGRAARLEAESLMDLLRIDAARSRYLSYPHELSGGMKQRVAIAIAVAGRPRLLVADESMRALDPMSKSATVRMLKDIQRERGMSLLLVSHNLHSLQGLADEILVMFAGRVVERAPAASLLARPRMPYTRALLRATPGPTTTREAFLCATKGDFNTVGVAAGCAYAARCEVSVDECRSSKPPLREVLGPHAAACWRIGDEASP
jgi:oligopeptide/dipeptide ABC transporter ATP-binding protein